MRLQDPDGGTTVQVDDEYGHYLQTLGWKSPEDGKQPTRKAPAKTDK